MEAKHIRDIMEAYASVYVQQEEEQLDEVRTDPRGRPASGPMSVYGGRGQDAGPGNSGDERTDRMDRAQRRVKATKPAKMGMAADSLHTKYSARRKGLSSGSEEGPGPKAPKRSGRAGRGANTDRGGGNAASRRAGREPRSFSAESYDLFDYILEHLVAEGYADTNKAALAIMANMSEEWKQSIVEGGINFSVPSRVDDFNNRRDELKNRYRQDVGPRIPGPGGGGQYGEPAAPKATGVRLAKKGKETKNMA